MKGYNRKTPLLGIPVPWYKDRIIPEVEFRRFCLIENMLIAGTQGVRTCVFDDGNYRLLPETDETYKVSLTATGPSPSASGIVGGAYFMAPSELIWSGLRKGFSNYLYLRATPKTYEDCSAVQTSTSEHLLPMADALLLAFVDLRDEVPRLNTEPDGKVYSADVARHAMDNENPHGRRMYQDELVVTQKLILRGPEGAVPTIDVEIEGEVRTFPASAFPEALTELAGRQVEIQDFESAGPDGLVLKAKSGKTVIYVDIQRRVSGPFKGSVGEIGVGYHGEDASTDESSEYAVYNLGDSGLPMRAFVICG